MGWTEYYATHFTSKGIIDRKKECDAYFLEGLNRGFYDIVKSRMVGSVYYAAVMPLKRYQKDSSGKYIKDAKGKEIVEDIPQDQREVFGFVMLTSIRDGYFAYKPISEDMGPAQRKCPNSVLDALTPTNNTFAAAWRKECRDNNAKQNLSKLPVGTEIEFEWFGKTIRLRKRAPAYQFKKDWWYNDADHSYCAKKRIPMDYTIVKNP